MHIIAVSMAMPASLNNQEPGYDRETAVLWLQQRLTDIKYFDPADGENSGVYDQSTFDAVTKLQNDLGIQPQDGNYGVVDQATFDAILNQSGTWQNPGDPVHRG
jgi:peptidoglycan hydrolase-like protein with peptidoglycan-binding domain